jgi:hypothetical protein
MKPFHWFIVACIAVVGLAVWWKQPDRDSPARLNYDTVGVSQGLTPQAQALNLDKNLDVSLLPDIARQVIREGAQKGLKEQAFLEYLLREVSTRVGEISTIDLNEDGVADPILVKPEPAQGDKYILLSLRVPDPHAYPLPEGRDAAAWKRVETFEVATLTVSLDEKALTVQAQPDQHLFPSQAGQHYAVNDTAPSFLSMYMTMRMVDWMFMPRMYGFYGPGWGYGYYRPVPVVVVNQNRGGALSQRGYSAAPGSAEPAIRGSGGGAPQSQYGRDYGKTPPKALGELKSSAAFKSRAPGAPAAGGGFGRPGGAPSAGSGSFRTAPRSLPRGGGFGRGGGRRR